jgi:hypothetical protein
MYLIDMTILAVKRKALSECAPKGQGRLREEPAASRQNKANSPRVMELATALAPRSPDEVRIARPLSRVGDFEETGIASTKKRSRCF